MNPAIDHIAVAVRSLEECTALFERLGFRCQHTETIEQQGVRVAFIPVGDTTVELLEPLSVDSPIVRYLGSKPAILHHIAFRTADLGAAMDELREHGLQFLSEGPQPGAEGKSIAFLHPRSAQGLLLELCQLPS